jgi:transcriptional regulator with XRE-family HTH domain
VTIKAHNLAERLKRRREAAGLSQQSLAVAAGLSMSLICQLEQGQKKDPRLSTLRALAKAFGITLDELVGDDPGSHQDAGEARTGPAVAAVRKTPQRRKGSTGKGRGKKA